jgi:hypothetical protein
MGSLGRRLFILGGLTSSFRAQEFPSPRNPELLELLGFLAEALSTANAPLFLEYIDPGFPNYDQFRRNIHALVEQWDLATSIEPLRVTGNEREQRADLDWFLELRAKPPSNKLVRRRERVTLKLVRSGKHWKVADLSPASLFSPIVPEVHRNSPR